MSHETEEYSQYVCIINACFYCAIAYATKLKIVMEDMNDKSCNVCMNCMYPELTTSTPPGRDA